MGRREDSFGRVGPVVHRPCGRSGVAGAGSVLRSRVIGPADADRDDRVTRLGAPIPVGQ